MKNVLIAIILLLFAQASFASYTSGYYRKNGTYVSGYHRTNPNYTKLDNYSTKGNINPYTGRFGSTNLFNNSNSYRVKSFKFNSYR